MSDKAAKQQGPEQKKGPWKAWVGVILIALLDVLVAVLRPQAFAPVARSTYQYMREMILILVPISVLIGLFEIWLPKSLIVKYLGRESGWKGVGLSLLLGTAPTGPLYVAFPIAAALMRSGASPMNVVLFLNAWAAIKAPQLLVETRFLGVQFMLLRLALTIGAALLMGWLIQKALPRPADAATSAPHQT